MLWFSLQVAKSKERRNSEDLAWASFYFYWTAVQVSALDDLWQIMPKKKRWETTQIQPQCTNHSIPIAPIQPLKTEPSENDQKTLKSSFWGVMQTRQGSVAGKSMFNCQSLSCSVDQRAQVLYIEDSHSADR